MASRTAFLLSLNIIFILSATLASAWSNLTYIYVCDEAVKYVWGTDVLNKCVYTQDTSLHKNFCETVLKAAGEDAYHSCIGEKVFVHPALASNAFFNDPQLHRDYSSCPIKSEIDARHLCSRDKNNPALEQALRWFKIAEYSADECARVHAFCVGSSYMADSYNPLNHILYGVDKGTCAEILDKKVEGRLMEPSPVGWSISQVCSFSYMQAKAGQSVAQRYAQNFGVSNKTFVDLLDNLTVYGNLVLNAPYPTTTTTVVTTTEIPVTTAVESTTSPPPTSIEPTMTTVWESSGVESDNPIASMIALIVVICILAVVGYSLSGQVKTVHHARKPKTREHGHARMTSLRSGEHEGGIMDEDRARSRLGRASGSRKGD